MATSRHPFNAVLGVLFISYLLVTISSTTTTAIVPQDEKLCGANLVKVLSLLCVEYHTAFSSADTRKYKGGVADECCRRHCNKKMLRSYCRIARNITDEENELLLNLVTEVATAAPQSPQHSSTEKNLEANIGEPEIVYVDLYTGPLVRVSPYYSTPEYYLYYNSER